MLILFLSCQSSEKTPEFTGEQLVENYHSAVCKLYSEDECVTAISSCGAPAILFPDWAVCMNDMVAYTSNCGTLPIQVEAHYDTVLECIETLETISCTSEEMCVGGDNIIRVEPCATVLSLIAQECIH